MEEKVKSGSESEKIYSGSSGPNERTEELMMRLHKISNDMENNAKSLEIVDYDSTALKHFQNMLSHKILTVSEMNKARKTELGQLRALKENPSIQETYKEIHEDLPKNDRKIKEIQYKIKDVCTSKSITEEKQEELKREYVELIKKEDEVKKSIYQITADLTICMMEENAIYKKADQENLRAIEKKIKEDTKFKKEKMLEVNSYVIKEQKIDWTIINIMLILLVLYIIISYS